MKQEIKEVSNVSEMGVCDTCGAVQLLSYGVCNYNGVCKGKVIPQTKEEPVSVSVEEAANKQFNKVGFNDEDGAHYCYIAGARFGANWHEEQSKLLVEDMLDVIRMFNATMTAKNYTERAFTAVESAITKAEQYLNK